MLLGLVPFGQEDVGRQLALQQADGLGVVVDGVLVVAFLELRVAALLHLLTRLGGGACAQETGIFLSSSTCLPLPECP